MFRNTGSPTCAIVTRHVTIVKLVIYPFVTRQVTMAKLTTSFCYTKGASPANMAKYHPLLQKYKTYADCGRTAR